MEVKEKAGPGSSQATGSLEVEVQSRISLDSSLPQNAPQDKKRSCPVWVVIVRACGCVTYIPTPCADPLCPICQKLWAGRVRARWFPVLERMREPTLITLTVKNGPNLAERWDAEAGAFQRFLDARLGRRSWAKLRGLAEAYFADHLDKHEPDLAARNKRLAATLKSFDQFACRLQAFTKRAGKPPRVRDIIGLGFSSREVTYSPTTGWHVHRHMTVDSGYIPWAVMVVLWRNATRGESWIVDIRRIARTKDGAAEAIKYVSKGWEIPDDKAAELRKVVWGKKRIWPLGGARPVAPEAVCECGRVDCPVVSVGVGDTLRMSKIDDKYFAWVRMRVTGIILLLERIKGERWRLLNLIPKAFACHSAEQGAFDTS